MQTTKVQGYISKSIVVQFWGECCTAAGISEAVLLRAAGAAQSLAGTSQAEFDKWWGEAPYGDDPVDQVWIKAGIDYAKSKGY